MTPRLDWTTVGWLTGAVVLLGALISCATVERTVLVPPEVEGAVFVGNGECVSCHTNIARAYPLSPHGRYYRDELDWAARTGCESCHGPGSRHVETGGGKGQFIVNPGANPASCFQCHLETEAEFNLPHHHPLPEGDMNCVQCHDPHGRDIMKPTGGLAMARLNESCGSCHREQTRPFVFVHEAMRESCLVCHFPHGGINRMMLTERDYNLCLKCHAQAQLGTGEIVIGKVDHTSYLSMGGCYSAGCHTAVHGSNVSPKLRY